MNRDDSTIVLCLVKALVRTCEKHGDRVVADLPAKIAAALARQRKAAMPAGALFHAAFTRARGDGLVEHVDASSATDAAGAPITALATGSVLPAADVGKSGHPILRPYWDVVRACPFHCPLDLPVADGANHLDTSRTVRPRTDASSTTAAFSASLKARRRSVWMMISIRNPPESHHRSGHQRLRRARQHAVHRMLRIAITSHFPDNRVTRRRASAGFVMTKGTVTGEFANPRRYNLRR